MYNLYEYYSSPMFVYFNRQLFKSISLLPLAPLLYHPPPFLVVSFPSYLSTAPPCPSCPFYFLHSFSFLSLSTPPSFPTPPFLPISPFLHIPASSPTPSTFFPIPPLIQPILFSNPPFFLIPPFFPIPPFHPTPPFLPIHPPPPFLLTLLFIYIPLSHHTPLFIPISPYLSIFFSFPSFAFLSPPFFALLPSLPSILSLSLSLSPFFSLSLLLSLPHSHLT